MQRAEIDNSIVSTTLLKHSTVGFVDDFVGGLVTIVGAMDNLVDIDSALERVLSWLADY